MRRLPHFRRNLTLLLVWFAALGCWQLATAKAEPTDTIDRPDLNGIICQQIALGQTPGEIAEQLHEGDARMSIWETGQRVWEALPECG